MSTQKSIKTILLILFWQLSHSQTHYQYSYDAAGNRIQRILLPPRLASPEAMAEAEKPVTAKLPEGGAVTFYPNPTKGKIEV